MASRVQLLMFLDGVDVRVRLERNLLRIRRRLKGFLKET